MMRLLRNQALPIGIDVGSEAVKLLQLRIGEEQPEVVAAARQPIPEQADSETDFAARCGRAAEAIRQALRQNDFHGRTATLCLPREITHVKNIRLPLMPVDEVEGALQFEIPNLFQFDTSKAMVRFLPAGEVKQGQDTRQEVIVIAARQQDVDLLLEKIHRAGVAVHSLDFEACALYRSIERFMRRKEDQQEVHVLVDVGQRRTQVVVGKGRDISFYKTIDIGGRALSEAVARRLGVSAQEAAGLRCRFGASSGENDAVRQAVVDATRGILEELAREIALCLRYYSVTFRGQRPGKVRVVGGGAGDGQLLAAMQAAMNLPVEPGRLLQNIDLRKMKATLQQGMLTEWATALGLGLRATNRYFSWSDGPSRETAVAAAIADAQPQGVVHA